MKKKYTTKVLIVLLGTLAGFASSLLSQVEKETPPESDVIELSVFEVSGSDVYGYRATTSLSATRVGMEIKDVPLTINVVTDEFLNDVNIDKLEDSFRYISNISGDSRGNDGINRIAGQSQIRFRGFPMNTLLRNGFRRTGNVTTTNVDRVEVIKGPVAVLYGQASPGGAVNYITKRPIFAKRNTLSYQYGSYQFHKVVFEHDDVLNESMAYRVSGSYENSDDWRDYERNEVTFITPSFSWRPNEKINVFVEYEYGKTFRNDAGPQIIGNPDYLEDFVNPPQEILDFHNFTEEEFREAIMFSVVTWKNIIGEATGFFPFHNSAFGEQMPEGIVPDRRKWSAQGPDAFQKRESHSFTTETTAKINDWIDLRYGYNYTDHFRENLDSFRQNTLANGLLAANTGLGASDNIEDIFQSHQVDVTFKVDTGFLKNRFVVGYSYEKTDNTLADLVLDYSNLGPVEPPESPLTPPGIIPDVLTGIDVYKWWDPSSDPLRFRDVWFGEVSSRQRQINERNGYYFMYQGETFEGRLHTMASVRHENAPQSVQSLLSENAPLNNSRTNGNSFMGGATFDITDAVTLFGSWNQNFNPNPGLTVFPGSGGTDADILPGEAQPLAPEHGTGLDIGFKLDMKEGKLWGTFTYFQLDRENLLKRDQLKIDTDPRNLDANGNPLPASEQVVIFNSTQGLQSTEGIELDFGWNPVNNYQLLLGVSYMWESGLVSDPSIVSGSLDERLFSRRLDNNPEWQISFWNRYTFTEGALKGVTVGLGGHGSAGVNVKSANPNNLFQVPSFFVFDAMLGYETKMFGTKTVLQLNLENFTDELYAEGNTVYADPFKAFAKVTFHF